MGSTKEISLNPLGVELSIAQSLNDDDLNSPFDDWPNVPVATSPRAMTATEALMQCAPGEEPPTSQEDLYPLREIIQDAIEGALTERERYVFDAVTVERVPLRELGRRLNLSKSQIHRIYEAACLRLAKELIDNDTITQHLGEK